MTVCPSSCPSRRPSTSHVGGEMVGIDRMWFQSPIRALQPIRVVQAERINYERTLPLRCELGKHLRGESLCPPFYEFSNCETPSLCCPRRVMGLSHLRRLSMSPMERCCPCLSQESELASSKLNSVLIPVEVKNVRGSRVSRQAGMESKSKKER